MSITEDAYLHTNIETPSNRFTVILTIFTTTLSSLTFVVSCIHRIIMIKTQLTEIAKS